MLKTPVLSPAPTNMPLASAAYITAWSSGGSNREIAGKAEPLAA